MNPSPRVSIVITCFNYAGYVKSAIESALAQDYPHIEIIALDDGSTDESLRVMQRYADRITVITQANSGQVAATNRAFTHCTGDIVMFLDADDRLLPGAVNAVVRHWTPNAVKAQFELEVIDGQGQRLGRRFCNYVLGYDSAAVAEEFRRFGTYVWPVNTGNAYSTAYLRRLMPLTVTAAPDGPLNTLAPLYGEVVVIQEVLGEYRLHDNNQSYEGVGPDRLAQRFARRVRMRQVELALLQSHAAAQGVALPAGPLIDQDLVFINYRLMIRKSGGRYEGDAGDSTLGLAWAAVRVLRMRPLPWRQRVMHLAWLLTLLLSPAALARQLVRLRFNRAAWLPRRRPQVQPG
jgi:glycosyltransferase involved in cell wall biosynthesis